MIKMDLIFINFNINKKNTVSDFIPTISRIIKSLNQISGSYTYKITFLRVQTVVQLNSAAVKGGKKINRHINVGNDH
jgi:hypothetical protein